MLFIILFIQNKLFILIKPQYFTYYIIRPYFDVRQVEVISTVCNKYKILNKLRYFNISNIHDIPQLPYLQEIVKDCA